MTQPGRSGRSPVVWAVVTFLLVVGVAGPLVVPLYARSTPKLGAFPFFYWYQLIWIPLVAIVTSLAYLLTRKASGMASGKASRGTHRAGQGRRDESR
jgi:Protein of unknown function (DUF3311)